METEKQCDYVYVGEKKMWKCELAEGHYGGHQAFPIYLPRLRKPFVDTYWLTEAERAAKV